GDVELRNEIDSLLGSDGESQTVFLNAVVNRAGTKIPPRIGRYEIKRLIGEGGMSSVFEGLQDRPRRAVAVKLLKGSAFSKDALRRFEYEAQVMANLRHPGIAQIYEAGTQEIAGVDVPYLALELIPDAESITEHAR